MFGSSLGRIAVTAGRPFVALCLYVPFRRPNFHPDLGGKRAPLRLLLSELTFSGSESGLPLWSSRVHRLEMCRQLALGAYSNS